MATLRAPSPRYRNDDPAPSIQLQEDDLALFWHIYCNRVMDAKSIYTLFPNRSPQGLSRRLNALRKGAQPYLHRLAQAPNRLRIRNGSDPQAYALAPLGAKALKLHRGVDIPADHRWTQKNRELRPGTIQHDLATSRFMARLYRDTLEAGEGVRLIYQPEFESQPKITSRGGLQNTLRTKINNWHGYRGEEGTAPDRIFAITANGKRQYFFLEMDAGTETIVPGERRLKQPSFWRDTSLLRKFVIYASAFENRAHQEAFDIPVFRVLTITTTPSRAEAMHEACAAYLPNIRPGLFLFTDWQSVRENNGSLLSMAVKNMAGRSRMILNEA
ncbi:MAG: replication-relaxation family protein [Rhodobacteraceae bacterium]|nr:replication-relaxation family protein [Paracoccaceae bacterium]